MGRESARWGGGSGQITGSRGPDFRIFSVFQMLILRFSMFVGGPVCQRIFRSLSALQARLARSNPNHIFLVFQPNMVTRAARSSWTGALQTVHPPKLLSSRKTRRRQAACNKNTSSTLVELERSFGLDHALVNVCTLNKNPILVWTWTRPKTMNHSS